MDYRNNEQYLQEKRIAGEKEQETMFEEYVPSVVAALVTVMLVTFVLWATLLESLGRRYHAYDVVGLMGTTSVMTACLVGLFVLFLLYGPAGKNCKGDTPAAVAAAEHASAGEEPRATIIEAYLREGSYVSTAPLIHATPDDERDSHGR